MRGTMLWFNEAKDLGFISTEDGLRIGVDGKDFVNGVRPEGRCAGLPVVFELAGSDGEKRAEAVRLEDPEAPRRARRRRGTSR